MPYEVESYETMPDDTLAEMASIWTTASELELQSDHDTYDLHLVVRNLSGSLAGWAAIRFAAGRLTADLSIAPGRGSLSHTAFLIDSLRVLSEGKRSIEWWSRGTSVVPARRVAKLNDLPRQRKIIRMERSSAPVLSSLKTRKFRTADAAAVVALNNAAFVDHPDQFDMTVEKLHHGLDQQHMTSAEILLTHIDGTLAGFIWTMARPNKIGELHVLAVSPEFQGIGLGGRLLDAGVDHLQTVRNAETTYLYVDADNAHAVSLYARHGFVDVKTPLISHLA